MLGSLMSAPGANALLSKNRVWENFSTAPLTAQENLFLTPDTSREIHPSAYDSASGVCIYLYTHGNPVNGTDPSGNNSVALEINLAFNLSLSLESSLVIGIASVIVVQKRWIVSPWIENRAGKRHWFILANRFRAPITNVRYDWFLPAGVPTIFRRELPRTFPRAFPLPVPPAILSDLGHKLWERAIGASFLNPGRTENVPANGRCGFCVGFTIKAYVKAHFFSLIPV